MGWAGEMTHLQFLVWMQWHYYKNGVDRDVVPKSDEEMTPMERWCAKEISEWRQHASVMTQADVMGAHIGATGKVNRKQQQPL